MAIYRNEKGKYQRIKGLDSKVYEYFKNRNFRFSNETITSYVLALQTKPFVILTGISGTGKTKIAQVFAAYVTQELEEDTKKSRVAFVSVRPDWMDNRGLLGYFNPITGKYQATPVLRLLLLARDNPGQPHFVILDEMNLAKVEYYFSDFLSVMESRTTDKPDGEPLQLHDNGEDTEAEDGLTPRIPCRLSIPSNVFFAGTVNVDETTYMFSPKVLDRTNVIEFNEVDLPGYDGITSNGSGFTLKEPKVREHFQNEQHRTHCNKADFDGYTAMLEKEQSRDLLAELYQILRPHHLHFGYRVINEISRFVVLASEQISNFDLQTALDIQFLQKVLPKLHGTKGKLQQPLSEIFKFCYSNKGGREPNKENLRRAMAFDSEALFPRTAQKVARMLHDLDQQGYTSFIQ